MTAPPDKSKPRIVSRKEYQAYRRTKLFLECSGVGMATTACFLPVVSIGICLYGIGSPFWQAWQGERNEPNGAVLIICMVAFVALAFTGFGLLAATAAIEQKADTMEPVALMTTDLTASLPAEESLVRASSEPLKTQQEALLRPARSSEETPSDQLLRPHG